MVLASHNNGTSGKSNNNINISNKQAQGWQQQQQQKKGGYQQEVEASKLKYKSQKSGGLMSNGLHSRPSNLTHVASSKLELHHDHHHHEHHEHHLDEDFRWSSRHHRRRRTPHHKLRGANEGIGKDGGGSGVSGGGDDGEDDAHVVVVANPYPVNCSCAVKVAKAHAEKVATLLMNQKTRSSSSSSSGGGGNPSSSSSSEVTANNFTTGLRSASFEVGTADGDGAVVVVEAFDRALSQKATLLPAPLQATKLGDRLRALVHLPPLPTPNPGLLNPGSPSTLAVGAAAPGAAAATSSSSSSSRSSRSSNKPHQSGGGSGGSSSSGSSASVNPTPLVLITSPGRGQGSEMVMVLTKALVELGLVELKCVVANLFPCAERASLVRGSLDTLGLHDVPCGVGIDPLASARARGEKVRSVEFNADVTVDGYDYLTRDAEYSDGHQLLVEVLEAAAPHSLVILCISALSDVAALIKSHRELFALKTKRVAMMGGVQESTIPTRPVLRHTHGKIGSRINVNDMMLAPDFLLPDNAQNNQYDAGAAAFVYHACQVCLPT
jgi:hypothetical protein